MSVFVFDVEIWQFPLREGQKFLSEVSAEWFCVDFGEVKVTWVTWPVFCLKKISENFRIQKIGCGCYTVSESPRQLPKSATLWIIVDFWNFGKLRCAPPTPPKNLNRKISDPDKGRINFWGVWGEHISETFSKGSHFLAVPEGSKPKFSLWIWGHEICPKIEHQNIFSKIENIFKIILKFYHFQFYKIFFYVIESCASTWPDHVVNFEICLSQPEISPSEIWARISDFSRGDLELTSTFGPVSINLLRTKDGRHRVCRNLSI